jgi:2,3-bisphosphoglycerate-dependent phosphoglycerate mutase
MKRLTLFVSILLILLSLSYTVAAQGKKTIILIRHAEKETSEMTDQNDPPLTAAGKERAERLVKKIGHFHPGAIYSTNYKRTRDTVEPLAKKRGITIQIYDGGKPQDLVKAITGSKTKRFVIVGHSNTIPPLANLITGKDLFNNLQDPEYSVIWVIRMKNGKVNKVEILDY